jgi:hypothetical protein
MAFVNKFSPSVIAEMRQQAQLGKTYQQVASYLNRAKYDHPLGRKFTVKDVSIALLAMGLRRIARVNTPANTKRGLNNVSIKSTADAIIGTTPLFGDSIGQKLSTKDTVDIIWQSLDKQKRKELVKLYIDQC